MAALQVCLRQRQVAPQRLPSPRAERDRALFRLSALDLVQDVLLSQPLVGRPGPQRRQPDVVIQDGLLRDSLSRQERLHVSGG